MSRIRKVILKVVFSIDAIVAIGFGLYSWLNPLSTFGTIIVIPEEHASEFMSILSSLSLFYILIGLTCLIGIKSKFPVNIRIALLMLMRHFLEGAIKIGDIGKDWLIGNPYPDLIIHSVFIIIYAIAVFLVWRIEKVEIKSTL